MTAISHPQRVKAFTLIEVIIAMTIFAMVIIGGFACFKMGLGLVENARHNTRSCQIMQSEIERVRSLPWSGIVALPVSNLDVSIASGFVGEGGYDAYTLKRYITGTGDSRVMTLEADWADLNGRSHSRTYVAQYTKGGLYDYIQ
jgi:prepilin-type N-terminal cleavage/methylation domain-containing protein